MPRDTPERFTTDMLDAVIGTLQGECARLKAVKEAMRVLEIKEISVRNSISLKKRGLPIVISFTQAAVDSLRDQRLGVK